MRIAVVQMDVRFGEVARNMDRALSLMAGEAADLYVLPELFTSGYLFRSAAELARLAEPADGPTAERLGAFCRERSCHVVAGFPEKAPEGIHNAAMLVGPGGLRGVYRKAHLFWDEKDWFRPGTEGFPVWEAAGTRIGILVCFDWAFPEAARALALGGACIVAHPANLVLPHGQQAMITRSLENRFFTATANRLGVEHRGDRRLAFTGHSQVTTPGGQRPLQLDGTTETCVVTEVDPAEAHDKHLTPRNHVLHDRRLDLYRLYDSPSG